jgi:hypothetical protein
MSVLKKANINCDKLDNRIIPTEKAVIQAKESYIL